MNAKQTRASHLGMALLLAGSLLFPVISRAEVTAVGIELKSVSGSAQYVVPAGKVLIIEHVAFCDSWTGKPLALKIMFSSTTVGNMWQTTITYNQGWNSLLRPIRLPAGRGAYIDSSYGAVFKCFLFGLLVDEADLYAGVPAAIQSLQVASNGEAQQVTGNLELKSPQPTRVIVQQTENLDQWQKAGATVRGTDRSPAQKSFAVNLPSATDQAFFRAHGQTRENLLPPLSPVPNSAIAVEDLRR